MSAWLLGALVVACVAMGVLVGWLLWFVATFDADEP